MVDNFELIKNFLEFKEGEFYFIQIMQRRKENPELSGYSRLIKSYYVDSIEYLNAREEEIKMLCKAFNARAYIRLTKRSYEAVAFENIAIIADYLKSQNLKPVKTSYDSACGKSQCKERYWVVDIDCKDTYLISLFKEHIERCDSGFEEIVVLEVPTLNGVHLITKPFNIKQLEPFLALHFADIHKNNPTLLYYES